MIIHLVGAQQTNYPWGFENRLIPAIGESGHTLISTDFRQERQRLPDLLGQRADLILVCKGEGIEPHILESCPCVTALWYAEQIGTPDLRDETALARRRELAFNLHAFDYAFSHDPANLLVYRRLGAEKVAALPCAAVDPALNRRLDIPKKHNVVFVGSKTPRRQAILESLAKKGIPVHSPDIWNAKEMNRLFNESRIVLNLHLSTLLNTETRIAEVLGAGSFLLSETLSDPDLVRPGMHFIDFTPGDTEEMADKIRYYLGHEQEREKIARLGHRYIHENHTYAKRIQTILDTVDFSVNRRIWPAYVLGVPMNTSMKPTLRLDRYNAMVRECLKVELKISDEFLYSQQWYDTEYHNGRLGLDVRTFDEIRRQYESRPYHQRTQAIFDAAKIGLGELNWLEVGCHVGMSAYWAACRYPQARLYLFDFSKTAIDWLKGEFPYPERAEIWQASVEDIRLPHNDLAGWMDVVTCMDVTEHLPDPVYRTMIAELKRVMKPGGLLILLQGTAPNEEHIHILTEAQIDEDFLAAGFEKAPSPQPDVHFFKKPMDGEKRESSDSLDESVSFPTLSFKFIDQAEDRRSLSPARIDFSNYKNDGWGLSRLAFQKIYDIVSHHPSNSLRIIEFGSGISTRFLIDFALNLLPRNIEIVSFDNDPNYMFKLQEHYDFFKILLRDLVECDDRQFARMFQQRQYDRFHMHPKRSPLTTRQKNNFYDINNGDITGNFDLVVLDGPNGNGRNLAFLHLLGHLHPGSHVLIDDFNHYDFIEKFQSIYRAEELFRNEGGMANQWEKGGDFIIYKLSQPTDNT